MTKMTRRTFALSAAAAATLPGALFGAAKPKLIQKTIHSSGEALPSIGMGTWQTFNVGTDGALRKKRTAVLKTFIEMGGTMVDSSPMYGSAQAVMGHALASLDASVFSADKIWTSDGDQTLTQLKEAEGLWRIKKFDLMQVHNLRAWEDHLPRLFKLKEQGRLRYVGITTSHGRRHSDFAEIMEKYPLDFVQLSYNIVDREVEEILLPLAQKRKIAVIVNRPFDGGDLIRKAKKKGAKLPKIAASFGCQSWAEFLLKFTISHPAVTVAIPATSKVAHMKENMAALYGDLPSPDARVKMVTAFQAI